MKQPQDAHERATDAMYTFRHIAKLQRELEITSITEKPAPIGSWQLGPERANPLDVPRCKHVGTTHENHPRGQLIEWQRAGEKFMRECRLLDLGRWESEIADFSSLEAFALGVQFGRLQKELEEKA